MGGFVTAGMAGQLVTVGMGGTTVIIIEEVPPKAEGGGIHNIYAKSRVQGLRADGWNKIQILRTVTANSEIPISILIPISITHDLRAKIIEQVMKWKDYQSHIKVTIINISNKNSVKIKETYINKSDKQVNIIVGRMVSLIDKAVRILTKESKVKINDVSSVEEVLDDIEKAEILKLLDDLDEVDEFEDKNDK